MSDCIFVDLNYKTNLKYTSFIYLIQIFYRGGYDSDT